MRRIITIIIATLLTNICAFGQFNLQDLTNADSLGISTDSLQRMDAYFHNLVDEKKLAGIQTGVMCNGQLIHFNTYGYANIEESIALTDSSVFRIFSMTKPIVSVALMQLFEQGKFKLDDPLYKYIPEFKNTFVLRDSSLVPAENPIRIVDILRHTSGYNYGRIDNEILNEYYANANLNSAENNKEFIEKLSKIPLQFEPGTNWQYGLSTNICGYLIEVLSGESLKDYLQNFIFEPLKMMDTHFELPKEKVQRFTTGYGWNSENEELYISETTTNNRYTNEVTLYNGGGGLVSTTLDYLKFCQMLLNKGELNGVEVLKPTTINLMFTDHLAETRAQQAERLRLPMGEASFGLGFAIKGENINELKNVFGWGGAAGTYFKVDVTQNLTYVMMVQISPYRHLGLRQQIQDFINSAVIK